jgi:ferredoxin-NADP reductase
MAILRELRTKDALSGNMLIFANKTRSDIIYHDELREMLGDAFINILSDEKHKDYAYGFVTEDFLKKTIADFDRRFYLCGPPPMMSAVKKHISALGARTQAITLEF